MKGRFNPPFRIAVAKVVQFAVIACAGGELAFLTLAPIVRWSRGFGIPSRFDMTVVVVSVLTLAMSTKELLERLCDRQDLDTTQLLQRLRALEVSANTNGAPHPFRLHKPPASTLGRFSRWVFSPRTFTLVLEPVLSDLQHDLYKALAEKRPIKARWVQLR